jgi:hypothetical protein
MLFGSPRRALAFICRRLVRYKVIRYFLRGPALLFAVFACRSSARSSSCIRKQYHPIRLWRQWQRAKLDLATGVWLLW